MFKVARLFVMLVISASLLAACNKEGETGGTLTKAKTPKEAICNMSRAIQDADKDLFLASIYLEDREFSEDLFEWLVAACAFGKEMERAFGKLPERDMPKRPPTEDEIAQFQIEEHGDRATAANPQDPRFTKPMPLIKKSGAWLVDLSDVRPKDENRARYIKGLKAMMKAYNEVRPKIWMPGITKEMVKQELSKAMQAEDLWNKAKGSGADPHDLD